MVKPTMRTQKQVLAGGILGTQVGKLQRHWILKQSMQDIKRERFTWRGLCLSIMTLYKTAKDGRELARRAYLWYPGASVKCRIEDTCLRPGTHSGKESHMASWVQHQDKRHTRSSHGHVSSPAVQEAA